MERGDNGVRTRTQDLNSGANDLEKHGLSAGRHSAGPGKMALMRKAILTSGVMASLRRNPVRRRSRLLCSRLVAMKLSASLTELVTLVPEAICRRDPGRRRAATDDRTKRS